MDLKKGLTYVAWGFLFVLVNLNLEINNGMTINFMPNWIGWFLLFLSFGSLGTYVSDKPYMKWTALVLTIASAITWLLSIVQPDTYYSILDTIVTLASAVYIYLLFDVVIRIAHDYGSTKEANLKTYRFIFLLVYIFVAALTVVLASSDHISNSVLYITGFALIAALVVAIMTLVTLFGLRKEVIAKL